GRREPGLKDDHSAICYRETVSKSRQWYVLVDLSKDRRSGAYCSPARETGRRTYHLRGKGELRSGKNADRRCGILRRGKPTCTGDEVVGRKLVTDLCRA